MLNQDIDDLKRQIQRAESKMYRNGLFLLIAFTTLYKRLKYLQEAKFVDMVLSHDSSMHDVKTIDRVTSSVNFASLSVGFSLLLTLYFLRSFFQANANHTELEQQLKQLDSQEAPAVAPGRR